MEKDRSVKVISIFALVIAITGMSLGFAAFSASLDLASNAFVSPDSATFNVKLKVMLYRLI